MFWGLSSASAQPITIFVHHIVLIIKEHIWCLFISTSVCLTITVSTYWIYYPTLITISSYPLSPFINFIICTFYWTSLIICYTNIFSISIRCIIYVSVRSRFVI
nr:MAG TPA: hypothetical protein [Caudoviricetes sp.]